MSNMFANVKMSTISLSDLNASNVTNMNSMFRGCTNLKTINVGLLDTTNVIDMGYMLADSSNLEIVSLAGLNTSNVTTMEGMLSGLPKIKAFDLSTFDFKQVANLSKLFMGDSLLNEVTMMTDVSSVVSLNDMFKDVKNDNTDAGTFYYNLQYNYSRIINQLPSEWNAIER